MAGPQVRPNPPHVCPRLLTRRRGLLRRRLGGRLVGGLAGTAALTATRLGDRRGNRGRGRRRGATTGSRSESGDRGENEGEREQRGFHGFEHVKRARDLWKLYFNSNNEGLGWQDYGPAALG